jgi:peptide subunit release factor 1 (eRF1)
VTTGAVSFLVRTLPRGVVKAIDLPTRSKGLTSENASPKDILEQATVAWSDQSSMQKEDKMFTEQDLDELVAFYSDKPPVLSLYLNVDSTQQSAEQSKLVFRVLLKQAAQEANSADIEAMEQYMNFAHDWGGKGLALFSCQDKGFWRSHSLAVPVHNRTYVSHRPYIKPLSDVLDAYSRYGVILVGREGARLFLFELGELVEATGALGERVRRTKHGGASGVIGMRGGMAARAGHQEDAVVQRNLKEVAEVVSDFCTVNTCTRLVLGGTDQNVSHLYDVLPKAQQDQVIGTFNVDMGAPADKVQSLSMELIEEMAQKREAQLVDEMLAGLKRGSGAVAGLSDTLHMLQQHRASLLLLAAGYEASGYRCQHCRYLAIVEQEECPLCGGIMEQVPDITDTMVHRALEQDTEVEIVRDNDMLEGAGKIGALLRY